MCFGFSKQQENFLVLKKYYFASIVIVLAVAIMCQAEFQVNTYTDDDQQYPAIAMDSNGNFVVVWRSEGQDGDLAGFTASVLMLLELRLETNFRLIQLL